MADEKEGPYKVVAKLVAARDPHKYSIVVEQKQGFYRELVPDAGEAQTARQLCNFLNKHHREVLQGLATWRLSLATGEGWPEEFGEVANDEAQGSA